MQCRRRLELSPESVLVIQGDTLWGGWGNDLLNADDDVMTGCATYGQGGATPLLVMTCDPARRYILLSVAGNVATLTIRTSYAEHSWPASAGADGRSSVGFIAADPALDQIAFSRGRFSVSGPGLAEIDIPAWAEPSRVIEDCRS